MVAAHYTVATTTARDDGDDDDDDTKAWEVVGLDTGPHATTVSEANDDDRADDYCPDDHHGDRPRGEIYVENRTELSHDEADHHTNHRHHNFASASDHHHNAFHDNVFDTSTGDDDNDSSTNHDDA